ncbi:MAG: NAD(P)H-hydrate epimerase, partial [Acidobacteriota bacterium]|nr:NAD(P)H-hydrate epimerase [Acidobacteriota bacterium]
MKKVVTSSQMGEIDRLTTEEFGVPSLELMENAARSVFEAIVGELGGTVKGKQAVVLCGRGNNGGDGAAVARMLANAGASVHALLIGRVSGTSGDARINFDRYLDECGVAKSDFEIGSIEEIEAVWAGLESSDFRVDVIVDAVFGTGLTRPVEGIYKKFLASPLKYARHRSVLLVSIDLPSGIDADKCETIGFNFKPELTVTFTSPKMANAMTPAAFEQGRLFVREIGSPCELIERADSSIFMADEFDVTDWLKATEFTHGSYKKKRGAVVIAAGSKAYAGAAVLAANGAIRSGAGIVTVAVPEIAHPAVSERVLPEVMVRAVSASEAGTLTPKSLDEITDLKS